MARIRERGGALCVSVSGLLGDVTGDGAVNIIDAQQIARWSVGLTVLPQVYERIPDFGDVNGDGLVNIVDAQQVARWSVELSVLYAVGEPIPPRCTGSIRVVTTSEGDLPDADGFVVVVDGYQLAGIGVDDDVTMANLVAADYETTLADLAPTCTITNGSATRSVSVLDGKASSETFTVSCTGAPPAADFTFSASNLDVTFTDVSIDNDGSIVSWSWDFGDG
ncbi:MAG: dockerin type I domain-containing protein, partial [Gemmatimonadota bacterium]